LGVRCFVALCLLVVASPCPAGEILSSSSGQEYEVVGKAGKGGFGNVYKAVTVKTSASGEVKRGRSVAIKEFNSLEDTLEEHLVLHDIKGLKHLPQLVDDGVNPATKRDFVVSRWVGGTTLNDWAKKKKRTVVEMVDAVAQAADAIADLNQHGWVHRDVKPQNIMISPRKRVTVIDVGLAQKKGADGLVKASSAGTRHFSAPEQRLKQPLDDRADVFGLSGTLYSLLLDQDPIPNVRLPTRVAPQIGRIADSRLRAILAKGLAIDPAQRYASASELAEVLRSWKTHAP
jgi:serine/threonine protein kinase